MRTHGKKYTAAREQVENKLYPLADALPLVQKVKFAKFDETVALSIRLGVDPKHADQMVRGTVVLPHGLGKSKTVLVIAGPVPPRLMPASTSNSYRPATGSAPGAANGGAAFVPPLSAR